MRRRVERTPAGRQRASRDTRRARTDHSQLMAIWTGISTGRAQRRPYLGLAGEVQMRHLGDRRDLLHICRVAAGAEDDARARVGVDVRRGDERARRVVDERNEIDRDVLLVRQSSGRRADKGRTYFLSAFLNISATSSPSTLPAPNPFVHRMSTPWSIRSCLAHAVSGSERGGTMGRTDRDS